MGLFKPIIRVVNLDWWSRINGFAVGGVTIFPFIFVSEECANDKVLIRHEEIHIRQNLELTPILFYVIYIGEYAYHRLSKSHYDAYMSISFEKEAYANQSNERYLEERKWFSQWRK